MKNSSERKTHRPGRVSGQGLQPRLVIYLNITDEQKNDSCYKITQKANIHTPRRFSILMSTSNQAITRGFRKERKDSVLTNS